MSWIAGGLGAGLLGGAGGTSTAVATAIAAGAILTMIADTMIPEAFEKAQLYTGVIASTGFLVSLALSQLG